MITLAPIESVSLSGLALEAIQAAIISGELAGGQPLRDHQLATDLGISRTPVREALHRLQANGLVEPRGRTGWVVSTFAERDVQEIFHLRRLLEAAGLEELARSNTPEQIESISGHFDDFQHPIPPSRLQEYFQRDDEFHKSIVAASGNSRIVAFYSVMSAHIGRGRYVLSGARSDRLEETLDEHLRITSALRAGDFGEARLALESHLCTGEALMIAQLRQKTS